MGRQNRLAPALFRWHHPQLQPCSARRDQPETFAVPDIDLPGMDFFGGMGAEGPGPADALPDDLLPMPSGVGGLVSAG